MKTRTRRRNGWSREAAFHLALVGDGSSSRDSASLDSFVLTGDWEILQLA